MGLRVIFLCVFLLATLSLSHASSSKKPKPENEWSRIHTPSSGHPAPIGFYSNGCLRGAELLNDNGEGYQGMKLSQRRKYGHPETLRFVQNLGKHMAELHSGILVEDIGLARGGPMPSGHASHQIGLDVDIWYWTHPAQNRRLLTSKERETLSSVTLLNRKHQVNPKRFTKLIIEKLKFAAEYPEVDRIFVNPAIKFYLCVQDSTQTWLHKLRPWPGHEEHFHVRLRCPKAANGDTNDCKVQEPIPPGSGCDQIDLNMKIEPHPEIPPAPLPEACTKLIKE